MAVARKASGQARAGLQSLRGQRNPAQTTRQGTDVLQSYTPADVLAQEEQAQAAQAQQAAEQQAAAAKAKADDERRRIEQASYAAADSFELGQNPLDSLTGQKDIFGAAPVAQDLQALQQRIKEQGRVADDRLLERERKLSDVVKSLERDIQKAKLDQIPAASVPDDARNKALEAGKEMANSIFDWTGKSSGVAKVKVAVMDSLMAQGYFDDGVANLAKQIVEELRNGSKSTPSVSLKGKATGDVLVMSNGTLYRVEGIDVARNFIRLVRNPDMLSERIVSMSQDDYDRLLADDEQTRQEALQQSSSQAIQDFLDGKSDAVPTLEEVQAGTLGRLEKELADWQVRRELPINQAQTGVIDEEIAKLQAQVDALRGAAGQEDKQPSITANPDLEAIFDQLDGITQRTQAAGQQAAAEHPKAERIQLVQKHILDILEDLEDSGKVTINC